MEEKFFVEDLPQGVVLDDWILDAAYSVFASYADGRGRYPDFIMPGLRAAGVMVQGEAGIRRLGKALQHRLKCEEKEERMFFFSLPKQKKKNKLPSIAAVSAVFILISAALIFFWRQAADKSQPEATFSLSPAGRELDDAAANTANGYPPTGRTESAIIDSLMVCNLFAQIKGKLNDLDFRLEDRQRKEIWKRLYARVPIVSDSLERVIKSAAETMGYKEALLMERRFDKEIFQLAGNSYRLRSDLVDN